MLNRFEVKFNLVARFFDHTDQAESMTQTIHVPVGLAVRDHLITILTWCGAGR